MSFSQDDIVRYARQIVLPEIGGVGQERLRAAKVLVIGAGGLGSPLLLYLAGAGVGTLGVVDDDHVELSNLHRQTLHTLARVGMAKTESAEQAIRALDPDIRLIRHDLRLEGSNAVDVVAGYDLVADGSDNFATRDAVHEACFVAGIPLVSAAIQGMSGLLSTFKAHLGPPHPCFRCLYPDAPPPGLMPSCAEAGVLGPAVGALGAMQAVEVVKELLEIPGSLSGTLVLYDALQPELRRIRLERATDCRVCGSQAARAA